MSEAKLRALDAECRAQTIADYLEAWDTAIREWHRDDIAEAAWLTFSGNYLLRTSTKSIAQQKTTGVCITPEWRQNTCRALPQGAQVDTLTFGERIPL